jgi:hypothetical protein
MSRIYVAFSSSLFSSPYGITRTLKSNLKLKLGAHCENPIPEGMPLNSICRGRLRPLLVPG